MVDCATSATEHRADNALRAQSWFTDSDKRAVSTAFDERETGHLRALAVTALHSLFVHLHGRAPKTLLDVGCGSGEGLAYAQHLDPEPAQGLTAIMDVMPPESVLYIVDVNRADEPNAFDAARTHAERSYLVDQYRAAYLPNELQQLLSAASALTERKLHTHVAADGLAGFPFGSIEQIALLNSPTFQKALRGVSRQQRHNGAPLRPLHAWVWPES